MLPIKTIIVDDEPGILLLLQSTLRELEGALVVGTATNATDAIDLIQGQNPNLAFLDIELPDMLGIELAEKLKEIKPDLAIVFVTAHREHFFDAFGLYAVDYILKPIDEERVKQTFRHIQQTFKISDRSLKPKKTTISINSDNQQIFAKQDEIFFIEKTGRYTLLHCVNGKYKTRQTLQRFEQKLDKTFFRSHKSYIINIMRIERIITYPNFYEIKFKACENKAFLSRDRYPLLVERLEEYTVFNRGN